MAAYTALVLAGRRGGDDDPLAPVMGDAPHRALLDLAGVPMLVRVLRALRDAQRIGRIFVSIDRPEVLEGVAELGPWIRDGSLVPRRAKESPSRSTSDVLDGPAAGEPVLVTTADHGLLRAEWVDHFVDEAEASGCDVLVGVVAGARVRDAYPDAVRTFLPLRGESYTGANLFVLRNDDARRAAAFWVRAEQFRKQPWRLVRVFGTRALTRFALGRLDLGAALEIASDAIGVRIGAVDLPFAEAAIDVDRPSDHALTARILSSREGARESARDGAQAGSVAPSTKRPVAGS